MTTTIQQQAANAAAIATTISSSASFFSSLLSPSLLSLSPLQSIVACLRDAEKMRFCRVSRDHHTILSRMRLSEYHTLTADDWNRIQQRHGPIVTSIQLSELIQLNEIPLAERGQIKRVKFIKLGQGTITRDLLPPLLEELNSNDDIKYRDRILVGDELPIMPSTLKKFVLGYCMKAEERKSTAAEMVKRILSECTQLTHVRMSVENVALFAVLPPSIEVLDLHMYTSESPASSDGWPLSLKHLAIEHDAQYRIELDEIRPPKTLISFKLPVVWQYDHYESTMKYVKEMSQLESIEFGPGISQCKSDIFALLPRSVTSLTYNAENITEVCETAQVGSLPDGLKVLKFPLGNAPVTKWPSSLRSVHIMGDQFAQDISDLPDSVEVIKLPLHYTQSVLHWPAKLSSLLLGHHFVSIESIHRFPHSVQTIFIGLQIVRKLMSTSTMPPNLKHLFLFGHADLSLPFDLTLMPQSLRKLTFDTVMPTLIGSDKRPRIKVSVTKLTNNLKEADMIANFTILGDPEMTRMDGSDPEEPIGFLPKSNFFAILSDEAEGSPSPAQLTSDELFYTETSSYTTTQYEVKYEKSSFGPTVSTPNEVLTQLTAATEAKPISGVSFSDVKTPPLIRALTDALNRGAITGPLTLIGCESNYSRQAETDSRISYVDGVRTEEVNLRHDMIGLTPIVLTPDVDSNRQGKKDMIDLLASMTHSKLTRIKIEYSSFLFGKSNPFGFVTDDEESEDPVDSVPQGFTAFCSVISRIPTLRTLVFRRWENLSEPVGLLMLQLLTRTLLSPECANIDSVDLSDCPLKGNIGSIVDLIRQTTTLKHIVLSRANLSLTEVWQLCQVIAVNRSLLTINIAGSATGVAGLHALRWVLRQNRAITIMVCHLDFGGVGIELMRHHRHARLKESNRVYLGTSSSGNDVELP